MALLRAFERKLNTLLREANQKKHEAEGQIRCMNQAHPSYDEQYKENYGRALKQSGISHDKVPFMKYFDSVVGQVA
jgi:hypothetical protein